MNPTPTNNGKWLVIAIIVLGVVAAVIGLNYRQFPVPDAASSPTSRQI